MLKKLLPAIAIGCLIGIIIGTAIPISTIIKENYLQYKMYATISGLLLGSINYQVLVAIIAVLATSGIASVFRSISDRFIRIISASIIFGIFILYFKVSTIAAVILSYTGEVADKAVIRDTIKESIWQVVLILAITAFIVYYYRKKSTQTQVFPVTETSDKLTIAISSVWIILFAFINITGFYFYSRNALRIRNYPNIVLIMVDTLRADTLKVYGDKNNLTPQLNAFADNSTVFESAMSQAPWTTWSVGSFMTSRYPQTLHLGTSTTPLGLSSYNNTLAESLKDIGYNTYAITSNPMWGKSVNGDQGFDYYFESDRFLKETSKELYTLADKKLDSIKQNKFFLFMLFIDTHSPYIRYDDFDYDPTYKGIYKDKMTAPQYTNPDLSMYTQADKRHMRALYDGEVSHTDYYVGKLIKSLKEKGLFEDSLIIFLSDHGEEFLDHGQYFHEKTLFHELINVPFIIKFPKQNQGKTVKGVFQLIDLFPSLLAYLRDDYKRYGVQGEDVKIESVRKLKDKPIYFATSGKGVELRGTYQKPYRFITSMIASKPEDLLFDYSKDPKEINNIFSNDSVLSNKIKNDVFIEDQIIGAEALNDLKMQGSQQPSMSSKQKEKLRSLGYLQ